MIMKKGVYWVFAVNIILVGEEAFSDSRFLNVYA